MENIKENEGIVVDVTESGYPVDMFRLPNRHIKNFVGEDGRVYKVWKAQEKPVSFKLNALQIEYFQQQTYPVVKIEFKRKDISWFKVWWYGHDRPDKVWDINVRKIGEKTVTMVKTASDKYSYLDQDVSIIENAINRISVKK